MRATKSALLVSVLVAQLGLASQASVSAMPLDRSVAFAGSAGETRPVIEVRNRGAGIAAGIVGGMILGGIIASQARPYYEPYPPYPPYPAYRPYPMGDGAIAYCMRRFKSYDPYSMTYLGYDGYRHPCP